MSQPKKTEESLWDAICSGVSSGVSRSAGSKKTEENLWTDPSFWGCCLLPLAVMGIVISGLLWKFIQWSFL